MPAIRASAATTGNTSTVTASRSPPGSTAIATASAGGTANGPNAGSDTLTVFWQSAPRVFDPVPTVMGGYPTLSDPNFVVAADVDGDGDLDLVSANGFDSTLTVFWQSSPGVFTEVVHLFLATGLAPAQAQPDAGEVFEVRWIALERAMAMAMKGEISDGKTVVGLARASAHLRSIKSKRRKS